MPLKFEIPEETDVRPKIVVVGLGGGGGNAVDTMIRQGLAGVGFVAGNTDGQALRRSLAETKVLLGSSCSKGLGAGGDPDKGAQAAKEDIHLIREHLEGADMCFVTAGMGGGTGTGSAPVVAQIARELGILTVGVVTRPFRFEGKKRERRALEGTDLLREAVDSIITIPNEKLMEIAGAEMGIEEAFQRADDVLLQAVRGISDLVVNEGVVNVDFADVKSIMSEKGRALMGTGYGFGQNRAVDAARHAINSPLLDDVSVAGATGVLINITGGPDMKLSEVSQAADEVGATADPDADIIFGLVTDPNIQGDGVKVTVIATGFDQPTVPDSVATRGRTTELGGYRQDAQLQPRRANVAVPPPLPLRRAGMEPHPPTNQHPGADLVDAEELQPSHPPGTVPGRTSAVSENVAIPAYLRRSSRRG